jgi:enoyl-[acyl-carrier protein] reductase II
MNSRICEICKIKYPVLLGPMAKITSGRVVAIFSQSGGLGCLATADISEQEFRAEVALIRSQTDRPFAVNIAWPTPNAHKIVQWSIEENIDVVISSAGLNKEGLEKSQRAGIKVFQVVGSVAQAARAEQLGVHGVIAKGFESGGLNAPNAVGTLALVPQIVDAVSIPVVAAGGIGDGRGFAAALALGAEGILMGTRFLATNECPISEKYKRALIDAKDIDTVSLDLRSFSARFLRNKKVIAVKDQLKGDESPWKVVTLQGRGDDIDGELLGAGQIAGLVRECLPVKEIIEELMRDVKEKINQLGKRVSSS